jgi:hypothetical protein
MPIADTDGCGCVQSETDGAQQLRKVLWLGLLTRIVVRAVVTLPRGAKRGALMGLAGSGGLSFMSVWVLYNMYDVRNTKKHSGARGKGRQGG